MFTATGESAGLVASRAVDRLLSLRKALEDCANFYAWLTAITDGELSGIGFTAADISAMRSAVADANELAVLYKGGGLGT
jgi:hypothetical protein